MVFRATMVTLGVAITALLIMNLYFLASGDVSNAHPAIEYKDFVTILLTALGVMIVVAAIAAVWGFAILKEEARSFARETALNETRAIVPRLVDEAFTFAREAEEVPGDDVAEEYGREGDDQ
jgi:hypothetical protein